MEFDPDNPVVQLCVKGMNAEGEGKPEEAHALFQQAWDSAVNNFEAFTAAHYLARNQKDPNDVLKWNLEALTLANTIQEEGIKGQYPSLYLNVAKSYELLENRQDAVRYYRLAADSAEHLPAGKYTDMIRSGIAAGLKRVGQSVPADETIGELINGWCQRKELRPLATILPAYLGNLGSESDRNKLLSALSYLSAMRCVNQNDQQRIEELIIELSAREPE